MSEADTQHVATTPEPVATPAAEVQSAQQNTSSLDELLSEYNTATTPQPAPQVAAPATPAPEWFTQAKSEIDAWRTQVAQERETKDFAGAIKEVKGDLDVPDFAVRGWLSEIAEQNPKINEIWNNRQNDPKAAKKLLASLKNDFLKQGSKIKGVDPQATADREAVAAAVRGTSTKAPEPAAPKYGDMSDAEFNALVQKLT